jgi:hypothetical protein
VSPSDREQSACRFRLPDGRIEANILDGELIVINLDSGYYFSSTGIGAQIWQAALDGLSVTDIANALAGHYGLSAQAIFRDASSFLQKLIEEGLLEKEHLEPNGHDHSMAAPAFLTDAPPAYSPPELTKFDDLVENFAIDPPFFTIRR